MDPQQQQMLEQQQQMLEQQQQMLEQQQQPSLLGNPIEGLKVVNWEEALKQTEGDEEFLKEVFSDFLTECDEGLKDMYNSINERNYNKIMNVGHRVKGSSYYIHAELMKYYSTEIQNAGNAGMLNDNEETLEYVKQLFVKFQEMIQLIRLLLLLLLLLL